VTLNYCPSMCLEGAKTMRKFSQYNQFPDRNSNLANYQTRSRSPNNSKTTFAPVVYKYSTVLIKCSHAKVNVKLSLSLTEHHSIKIRLLLS
jgi:hypothetical protein